MLMVRPPDAGRFSAPVFAALVAASALAGQGTDSGAAPGRIVVPADGVTVEREVWLMGSPLRVRVAATDAGEGAAAIEAALLAVEELEAELSSWLPSSDLGRLRAAPAGEAVRLGPRTAALLAEARAWSDRTGGAFDPAVGSLVDAWDLRGAGRTPDEREIAAALRASGWDRVRLDVGAGTVARRDPATWIDAGGFGKGTALRGAAEALGRAGIRTALLDFGGQLLVRGDDPSGTSAGWAVALSHPARRDSALLTGRLLRGSLATSGQSERGVDLDTGRIGHLFDPRTGAPVPAWGSVAVVADDPLAADALATALFVMGPEEGARWIADRDDAGAVFLLDRPGGAELLAAGALEGRLRLDAPRTHPRTGPGVDGRSRRITPEGDGIPW